MRLPVLLAFVRVLYIPSPAFGRLFGDMCGMQPVDIEVLVDVIERMGEEVAEWGKKVRVWRGFMEVPDEGEDGEDGKRALKESITLALGKSRKVI